MTGSDAEWATAQDRIKAALPAGWQTLGMLMKDIALDGREPQVMWELGVQWATEIDGGRTMYLGSWTEKEIQPSARRLEVKLRAPTVDDLIAALDLLPTDGLERFAAGLRWPIEFVVDSVLLP